jgi:spore maturation protein CgeB
VLNDHWPDMRRLGFISNRVFDVLACEGFVLSDRVAGLDGELADVMPTFRDADDVGAQVGRWLGDEPGRRERARAGRALVAESHSADIRAGQLVAALAAARRPSGRPAAQAAWEATQD